MKICFVADAHSPIAANWISYFQRREYEISIISSYRCLPENFAGAKVYEVPIGFSQLSQNEQMDMNGSTQLRSFLSSTVTGLRSGALSSLSRAAKLWVSPIEVHRHVKKVRDLISQISPDLVHAMRIPFEGILAAKAIPPGYAFVVSVWGNDFTLWANRSPLLARQTKQTLQRANALHCDCYRDLHLAWQNWGFDSEKPAKVLPGAGGIQTTIFHPGEVCPTLRKELDLPDHASVVINPRGFRGYIPNDVFFKTIPLVIRKFPSTFFVCTSMRGNPRAEKWMKELNIQENVLLLPLVPRYQMAELFRLAQITVSPSLHDGTPNTLLEAMACGCFPVAGDIESVREWITDGVNGILCDPKEPGSLADALLLALRDEHLRSKAKELNTQLIAERAEYGRVMTQAEEFYREVTQRKQEVVGN